MLIFILKKLAFLLFFLILASLVGCNMPASNPTSPGLNVTQAYQTVEARLTQAVILTPSFTPSSPPTETGIATPTSTIATAVLATQTPTSAPSATAICDRAGAGNPIDLTIPDDTRMQPGQAFTKRWALQNTGACTWTREYSARFFSGEQMSAPESVFLSGNVIPGQTVEITIDMVAPLRPGTYQGNWKLRNPSNVLFGIGPNGSAPFWVKIVVVQPSTATPTPTNMTPTATVTPTPVNYASGSATLVPGSKIDLDSGQVNTGSGEDLSYESDSQGSHFLVPQENVSIGVYGAGQPGIENCQAASMQAEPLNVENLPGSYLCYRTGQGLPGRALVTGLNIDDFSLNLEFLTWSQP